MILKPEHMRKILEFEGDHSRNEQGTGYDLLQILPEPYTKEEVDEIARRYRLLGSETDLNIIGGLFVLRVTSIEADQVYIYSKNGIKIKGNCDNLFNTYKLDKWHNGYIEYPRVLDLSNIDIQPTSARRMFNHLRIEEVIFGDIDTSKCVNMTEMFMHCDKLKEIDLSGFDTRRVMSTTGMFEGCRSLVNIVGLGSLNLSNVRSIVRMFYHCENITAIDLSKSNLKQLKGITNAFNHCCDAERIDLGNCNTSAITNMTRTFSTCLRLKNLDLSKFDTHNVKYMVEMFEECQNLKNLDLSSFRLDSAVDISCMFEWCKGLETLNLHNFRFDRDINAEGMLRFCNKVKKLDITNLSLSNLSKRNRTDIFYDCTPDEIIATDKQIITNWKRARTIKSKKEQE